MAHRLYNHTYFNLICYLHEINSTPNLPNDTFRISFNLDIHRIKRKTLIIQLLPHRSEGRGCGDGASRGEGATRGLSLQEDGVLLPDGIPLPPDPPHVRRGAQGPQDQQPDQHGQ